MITKTEQNEIQDYLKDASNTKGYCDAVVYPENTDDVVSIIKQANSEKLKLPYVETELVWLAEVCQAEGLFFQPKR